MKYLLKIFFVSLSCFFSCGILFSQTIGSDSAKLKISGYVDVYYAHYTDSVGNGNYQKFPSISPRSDAFGLNTAMITAEYDGEKVRAVTTLHFGDVARSVWSTSFNPIMEAHAGVRLCKKLWIDAGFFRTHFGTEGLLPRENFCSSVSVNTFYEPYYESGVRLNYNPCDKLAIYVYALNGYGMFEDNNHKKSLGTNITYALGEKGNCGYTNYIGDDSPIGATVSHLRIHQNLFLNYQIRKLKFQVGGDFCLQKNSDIATGTKTSSMYSGVVGLKQPFCKLFSVYARGEIFNDPQGIMSGVILDSKNEFTGYELWGATLGVEYRPTENSYLRLESRDLQMNQDQKIFRTDSKNVNYRIETLLNFGISF